MSTALRAFFVSFAAVATVVKSQQPCIPPLCIPTPGVKSTIGFIPRVNVSTTTSTKYVRPPKQNVTTPILQYREYKSVYEFLFLCSAGSRTFLVLGILLGIFYALTGIVYCFVLGFISQELRKGIPDEPTAVEMTDVDNSGDNQNEADKPMPDVPPVPKPEMTYQQEMCDKVCMEIIATERNFKSNMETLQELYFKGLKGKSHLIADYDLLNIFQHVESVLGVSTSLLEHYDEEEAIILKSGGQTEVIRTRPKRLIQTYKFIEPYLKVYSAYCNHYEESLDTLRRCYTTSKKLEEWLDKTRHHPRCLGLSVIDLLIQPVQRICKYPLLFDELLKHMDSDDPQTRRMLEETRILIKEAAKDVDRRAQESIHQKKMRNMHQRLSVQRGVNLDLDNFITPTRKFECEMKVDILDSNGRSTKNAQKGAHLLLFSDYLVLAMPKTKSGAFDLDCDLQVTFASPIKMFNVRDIEDNRAVALMGHRHFGQQTGTDRIIIRFDNVQQQKTFKDHQLACQQMVFRGEANLNDRRAGMTKTWAKTTKNQYLKNKSSSQSLTDQLDNMADNYRNRSPVSGVADPATLEVLADTLARAERAEAELRMLRAAANQNQMQVDVNAPSAYVGVGTTNEMDLL